MAVWRGDNVRDTVTHAESRHFQGFVEISWAVIDARQYVTVNVQHHAIQYGCGSVAAKLSPINVQGHRSTLASVGHSYSGTSWFMRQTVLPIPQLTSALGNFFFRNRTHAVAKVRPLVRLPFVSGFGRGANNL